jgi:hypothetical protein
VPFGCRVATFLVELAAQRSAKGFEVAIISNDVDVIVASRVGSSTTWRHLGFMFIDDEFLLPGLVATGSPKGLVPTNNSAIHQTTSCRVRQSAQPKIDHLHVEQPTIKMHAGQGRSGTATSSEAQHALSIAGKKRCDQKVVPSLEQEPVDDSDLDGVSLDGTLSPQRKQPTGIAQEQPLYSSLAVPTSLTCEGMSTFGRTSSKEIAGVEVSYADTQIDGELSHTAHHLASGEIPGDIERSRAAEHERAVNESLLPTIEQPLQPTIEQDGPPEIVPSTQQQVVASMQRTEGMVVQVGEVAHKSEPLVSANSTGAGSAGGDECSRVAEVAAAVQGTRVSASSVDPPKPTQTLEMDTARGKEALASLEIISVEDANLPVVEAAVEALPTVPGDIQGPSQTTTSMPRSSSQILQAEPVPTGDAASLSQPPRRRMQLRRLGSQKRQLSAGTTPKSSPRHSKQSKLAPSANSDVFAKVDALLGDWMRNGRRTHTVKVVNGARGEIVEFQPSAGSSLPIEREENVWSLNGYALDEVNSTTSVLRWQHATSGATRLWWRPGAEAPADDMLSHETPASPKPMHR